MGSGEDRGGESLDCELPTRAWLLRVLLGGSALVFLVTLAVGIVNVSDGDPGLLGRFDAAGEGTVGAWFSAVLLLIGGGLALTIGVARRAASLPSAAVWLVLGALLVVASADEVGQLHEEASQVVTDAGELIGLGKSVARGFAVAALLMALAAGARAFAPWLRGLTADLRRGVLLAAAIYLGGAVGLEIVQRLIEVSTSGGTAADAAELLKAPEELFEMVGASVFVVTLWGAAPVMRFTPRGAEPV